MANYGRMLGSNSSQVSAQLRAEFWIKLAQFWLKSTHSEMMIRVRIGVDVGSPWVDVDSELDRCWADLGSILGRFAARLGVDIGSMLDRRWVDMGSIWGRFTGRFAVDVGRRRVDLVSNWCRSGVDLVSISRGP